MEEALLRVTQSLAEAWNDHDIERIVSLYAPDFEGTDVSFAAQQKGRQAIRKLASQFLEAFPDLEFENEEVICQDNRVAVVWKARGTHRGVVMNIPPTHREVSVQGISLLTIHGEKVTHSISVWDMAGFLRAIRLLPEL